LQHKLNATGKGVTRMRGAQANPAAVARAVTLLQALDREIRLQTHSKRSLDDVSQALMRMDKVNTQSFIQLSESVLGGASEVLDTPLLR
jgi:urocanate hydratase